MAHPLDNPIWSATSGRQAVLSRIAAAAARYEPEVAPFASVKDTGSEAAKQVAELVAPGEQLYFVAVAPDFGNAWRIDAQSEIYQMTCTRPIEAPEIAPAAPMTHADVPAMVELTTLVFPGFFRPRTVDMGAYTGIWRDGRLAAMAGERMAVEGYTEVSAVCTHPAFTGRGYASQLVAQVTNAILGRGETAFLHVSVSNERAHELYLRLGFAERARLPLWLVTRLDTRA